MRTSGIATALVLAVCLMAGSGAHPAGIAVSAGKMAGPSKGASWTLAVYMDSDNDLDYWAEKDIQEMMRVGSGERVNVILFRDGYITPGYVFRVLPNALEMLRDCRLNGVEPNMGDAATLREFVSYTVKKFPARHFALILWDHGDDFRGSMFDNHIPGGGFDYLTHQEAVSALSGFRIDLLAYAACVMSMIEVVYEYYFSGLNIDYYVATEGYDPMDGLPYDLVLAKLTARPDMSPSELAGTLVDEYIDYYTFSGKAYSQAVTLSAVEVAKAGQVVSDLRNLTELLRAAMHGSAQLVSDARGRANLPWSQNGWERLIDLPTFVKTIHDKSPDPRVLSSSQSLLLSLASAIYYTRNVPAMDKKGCLGLGVYFPTSRESYQNNRHLYGHLYERMRFPHEGWLDFLNSYWDWDAAKN